MAMTIAELGRALRTGQMTSRRATERCLANIEARNRELNAFILVRADDALRNASEADRELAQGRDRGPLHGVPISIKDLMDVAGTPTTAASRVRTPQPAIADAPAVAHLRAAGAVFVGKTNLHEYALGTTSEDSAFGAVKNPIDPSRSAGGSSGGSAVSVAVDMAFASIGTDTGGSIRIPAAACGIVGLKPSYGEVSAEGVIPLSPRFDHVGPLARTVADAWTVLRALAGDPRPAPLTSTRPSDVRLLALRRYFCDFLDDDVRARFEEALHRLSAAGMHVGEAVIRHADTIVSVYQRVAPREAFLQHAATLDTVPERYTAPVRHRLEVGRAVSLEDFASALDDRAVLQTEVDALADGHVLVLPTLPIPAPKLGAETVPVGATEQPTRAMMLRDTQLFNLTGHPAISLPCGVTRDGLPCGLQLVGPRDQTEVLIRIALACERVLST